MIGCNCRVCNSPNPANNRLRTSVLLQLNDGKKILIDTTPDLRTQLLRANITRVDAVLVTHDHADHTHGMDDLRPLCRLNQQIIPIHATAHTAAALRRKFDYVFDRERLYPGQKILGGGIPTLSLQEFDYGQLTMAGHEFETFPLPHGHFTTAGFRQGKLAYLIDCHDVPKELAHRLRDAQLDWLVLDCVQPDPHETHLGFAKACEILTLIRPKRAGLIHMNHAWDHEDLTRALKEAGMAWAIPLKDGDVLQY